MRKKDFLDLVMIELNHIKENATTKEIDKLNINFFDHTDSYCCIYGLMTGECSSERARELYSKSFDTISDNNWEVYTPFSQQTMRKGNEFTALEKYLFMISPKQDLSESNKYKEIISYLKGEINEIIL